MAEQLDTKPTDAPAEVPCSPCSGSGTLISGSGGTPHEVPCPWCEGTGVRIPGHDAQAARRGDAPESGRVAAEVD